MLRPQDILILTKIAIWQGKQEFSQFQLAYSLSVSQAEISLSLRRSEIANLYEPTTKKVNKSNLLELIVYGIKYIYPAEMGTQVRGMPTAWSAKPLSEKILETGMPVVWPSADGAVLGIALEPIYKSIPKAASDDAALYRALALMDAIRSGKARDRTIAVEFLNEEFGMKVQK